MCFNPSQVQFTLPKGIEIYWLFYVSIPHRFNSHCDGGAGDFASENVSIPHRFNSHENGVKNLTPQELCFNPSQVQFTRFKVIQWANLTSKFQSLTGSIHTVGIEPEFIDQVLFQSLTGSIHTVQYISFQTNLNLFQSLTGSIHTGERVQDIYIHFLVSIPHRFNSHLLSLVHSSENKKVSIPHRFNSHMRS